MSSTFWYAVCRLKLKFSFVCRAHFAMPCIGFTYNVRSCVEHTLASRVSALAKTFARLSSSNCGCRVSALVLSVSSGNRFCSVSVLAKRWLMCRARIGGCRVSVLLIVHMSVDCSLVSLPFQRFLQHGQCNRSYA